MLECCPRVCVCFWYLLVFSMFERWPRHFVVAGLERIPSDVSCGNDVENELALELKVPVDCPGTTTSTKVFRAAQDYFAFGVSCGF